MTASSTATAAISDEQRWTSKLDTFPHTSKGAHLGQASEEQRSSNKREKLKKRNINLVSLTEDVNTSTPTGMLFFQLIAMLAEFEHNLISERTKAGLEAARARGRTGGRPKLKPDDIKIAIAKQLHASNSTKIKEICHTLHISKAPLYRYLKM